MINKMRLMAVITNNRLVDMFSISLILTVGIQIAAGLTKRSFKSVSSHFKYRLPKM
jgi:hypothetical protein